jgi:hypothetical protein
MTKRKSVRYRVAGDKGGLASVTIDLPDKTAGELLRKFKEWCEKGEPPHGYSWIDNVGNETVVSFHQIVDMAMIEQ